MELALGRGSGLRAHSFSREGEFTLLSEPIYTALSWEGNLDSCCPLLTLLCLSFTLSFSLFRCYQLHCHPGGCGDRPSQCGQSKV